MWVKSVPQSLPRIVPKGTVPPFGAFGACILGDNHLLCFETFLSHTQIWYIVSGVIIEAGRDSIWCFKMVLPAYPQTIRSGAKSGMNDVHSRSKFNTVPCPEGIAHRSTGGHRC